MFDRAIVAAGFVTVIVAEAVFETESFASAALNTVTVNVPAFGNVTVWVEPVPEAEPPQVYKPVPDPPEAVNVMLPPVEIDWAVGLIVTEACAAGAMVQWIVLAPV